MAAMVDELRLFKIGASFGGFESLIVPARPERTARPWRESGFLLRLHVGLEAVEDLIADLEAGFGRLRTALRERRRDRAMTADAGRPAVMPASEPAAGRRGRAGRDPGCRPPRPGAPRDPGRHVRAPERGDLAGAVPPVPRARPRVPDLGRRRARVRGLRLQLRADRARSRPPEGRGRRRAPAGPRRLPERPVPADGRAGGAAGRPGPARRLGDVRRRTAPTPRRSPSRSPARRRGAGRCLLARGRVPRLGALVHAPAGRDDAGGPGASRPVRLQRPRQRRGGGRSGGRRPGGGPGLRVPPRRPIRPGGLRSGVRPRRARPLRSPRRRADPRRRARGVSPPPRRELGAARRPSRSLRVQQGDRQRVSAGGGRRPGLRCGTPPARSSSRAPSGSPPCRWRRRSRRSTPSSPSAGSSGWPARGPCLRDGLARQARAHGLRITQSGPVQLPFLTFAEDVAAGTFDRANVFTGEAARRGVWLHPWHNWFLSAAHADDDVGSRSSGRTRRSPPSARASVRTRRRTATDEGLRRAHRLRGLGRGGRAHSADALPHRRLGPGQRAAGVPGAPRRGRPRAIPRRGIPGDGGRARLPTTWSDARRLSTSWRAGARRASACRTSRTTSEAAGSRRRRRRSFAFGSSGSSPDVEPTLGAAVTAPRMTAILDQLVGPGARLIQDMALMKPPHRGAEKPWHQDNAYFDWTPLDGVIGVWIALDPATVENGCMQIVPGSHRAGPAPHYHARDCQLVDEASRAARAEVVPLGPGGALFFSALLHHGTPPNRSPDRRRALQFHYAAARCRRMTFREHMTHFALEGAYVGCRDWDMDAGVSRARLRHEDAIRARDGPDRQRPGARDRVAIRPRGGHRLASSRARLRDRADDDGATPIAQRPGRDDARHGARGSRTSARRASSTTSRTRTPTSSCSSRPS